MEKKRKKEKTEEEIQKEKEFKERMERDAKLFGKRMIALRKEKADKEHRTITPTTASEEIGIHVNALNNYEYDRFPQIEQLVKIKEYYGVSFDRLLGLSELDSADEKYKAIHEVTGFLDENIDFVKNLKSDNPDLSYLLNCILREDTLLKEFLSHIQNLILKLLNSSCDDIEETREYEIYRITNITKAMVEKLVEQNIKEH